MKAYKNRNLFGSTMVLLSCILLFSCEGEDIFDVINDGYVGESICFGVSQDGNAQTRSLSSDGGNEYTAEQFVLRSQDSADTLCVRAIVSEGIHSSCGRKAVTRAAPVREGNFYDEFHVLAYWKKGGPLVEEQFYMDEIVTSNGSDIWTSDKIYYWPGDGNTLQFYALAPVDDNIQMPTTPESAQLSRYTVPKDVANQQDILVATTAEFPGNSNQAVPLTFKHICTAVRFETGSQMQAGTISSVTLKGIKNVGTYDMATDTWALTEATDVFTQELKHATTGTETAGSEVTSAAQTFMMLPQTLSDGATVEVVFVDGTTGTERTLSASIAGMEWPQGTTVTYRISITPEYELEFISEPEIQDAHYIIYPIHIKAGDNIPGGSWTLTSTDSKNVTLRTGLTILTRRGFWVEEDKGTASITSTAVGDDITVYAFLTENAGEATREINLELKPTNSADAIPQTFTISQLCPSWNGNLGCERFEDKDDPWGFLWPEGMTVTYNMENAGLGDLIKNALLNAYLSWFTDYGQFITKKTFLLSITSVTINYDAVPQVAVAKDENNGLKNTLELYNFNGINDVSTLEDILKNWGGVKDKTLPLNPAEFAARSASMRNKFHKTVEQQAGQTIEVPVLPQDEITWYLPSKNEAMQMKDETYPLNGNYWTSTNSLDEYDNQNAFMYYSDDVSTGLERRDVNLHVRAVRKKP